MISPPKKKQLKELKLVIIVISLDLCLHSKTFIGDIWPEVCSFQVKDACSFAMG